MSEDPVESGCLNCAGAGAFLTVGVLVLWACEVAEHLLGLSKGTVQTPGAFVAFVVAVMAAVKVERWVNSSQARREASADPRQRMRDAARLRGLVLDEDLIDRLLGELPNNRARYRALDRVRRALRGQRGTPADVRAHLQTSGRSPTRAPGSSSSTSQGRTTSSRVQTTGKQVVPVSAQQRCPYCREGLQIAAVISCGACRTVLHKECLEELGGCPTQGCRNNPRERRPRA
ncbi:MAG TPA: hypothetical protein DEA08_31050 [Planctomycetes bacterium]|nr:hypothetical protein [Planctomycetota bacterium]